MNFKAAMALLILILSPIGVFASQQDQVGEANSIVLSSSDVRAPTSLQSTYPSQKDADAKINSVAERANSWLIAILLLVSLALIISVLISFYLYRWRRILLSSPHLLVPEELGARINGHEKAISGIHGAFVTGANEILSRSDQLAKQVANMTDTFMTLQTVIDEKELEIKRFKSGYDSAVFRRFLFRFIRVLRSVEEFKEAREFGESELLQLSRLLEDALDECGVEMFAPEIGEDYREVDGVADNPKAISTDDPAENFKIVEIVEPGYRLRTETERFDILVPAKVVITFCKIEDDNNGSLHRN